VYAAVGRAASRVSTDVAGLLRTSENEQACLIQRLQRSIAITAKTTGSALNAPAMVPHRPDDRRRLERIAAHVAAASELPAVPEGRLPGALSGGCGERDPESAFSGRLAKGVTPLVPRSTLPQYDPPGADALGLSPEEISQFRELGYVIKRGLIPQDVLQPFSELWWSMPPVMTAELQRDDPNSWINPGRRWPTDEKAQMAEQEKWGVEPNWMGGTPWPSPNDKGRDGANPGERVGRLPHKLTGGGEQASRSHNVWRWCASSLLAAHYLCEQTL
jgi:hypothetical protein